MRPNAPEPAAKAGHGWAARIGGLVLFVSVVLQAALLLRNYLLPWGSESWALRTLPAWERSSRLSAWLDDQDTEFIRFLRQAIPANAEVIVTRPNSLDAGRALLQYLLFPRRVSICVVTTDPDCLITAIRSGKFLIAVDGRPGQETVPASWRYIPFEAGRGYYRP